MPQYNNFLPAVNPENKPVPLLVDSSGGLIVNTSSEGGFTYVAANPSNQPSALHINGFGELLVNADLLKDNQGILLVSLSKTGVFNITTGTVITTSLARLVRINVIVAGAAGAAYDAALIGNISAANQICTIPAVVGTYEFDWPCINGITIVPGAAQVVSVTWN